MKLKDLTPANISGFEDKIKAEDNGSYLEAAQAPTNVKKNRSLSESIWYSIDNKVYETHNIHDNEPQTYIKCQTTDATLSMIYSQGHMVIHLGCFIMGFLIERTEDPLMCFGRNNMNTMYMS